MDSELKTKPCPGCGAALAVTISNSPIHGRSFEVVDTCQTCRQSLEDARERERRAILVPGYIRDCGVNGRWQAASLDSAIWPALVVDRDNADAVSALRAWVMSSDSTYVWGTTGSGKSTLAKAALLDCCRQCEAGLFLPEAQIEDEVHKDWSRDLIRKSWSIDVLVLDDIGSRPLDDRMMILYRDIFDARYDAGLKTLITGQKRPEELIAHWRIKGGAIRDDVASRLGGMLNGRAIEVKGSNRRARRG